VVTVFYSTTRPTSGPPYTTSVDVTASGNEIRRGIAERRDPRRGTPRFATKGKVWEPAILGAFLDRLEAAGDRFYPLVHLAAFTGPRRGEVAGLKWSAVDLERAMIKVERQHSTAGYEVVEGAPKTPESEGAVDIDSITVRVLRRWRAVQAAERLRWGPAYRDSGHVFTREDGVPYHPDYISKRFQRLVAAAGLPATRLHDLRHLAASLQLAAGVDIAIVSKRLRHSSIGITSDTYGHLVGTVGRDAAERAAALVPRQASGGQAS
jgi:integrase